MILSVYMYNCYQYDITLLPRKSNIMFSQKNTLKVEICGITENDDIYPRKYGIFIEIPYRQTLQIDILERVLMALCAFIETFTGVFIYCFPVKKKNQKTGNLIHMIEIGLLLQFICLEILYNQESSKFCTIQATGVVFRGVIECQLRKLFFHQEMSYNSKNIIAAVKVLSLEVDRTFLKMRAKNLEKVTRIGEVLGIRRQATLRNLSFQLRH